MKFVTLTATALVATAISAAAMTSPSIVKSQVNALGLDGAIVDTLNDDQIRDLKFVLHNGSDSHARGQVRNLLNSFAN